MPHKEDDISYLLSQISEGNSSCFEKMYKRYFKKCYSIALYFVQLNPEKPDVPLNKNDAFQKVQKRHVQEKR